jgi:hypothetical protein
MDDAELAALQAALMTALRCASSPEDAFALLSTAPLSEASQRWIRSSDPRAIETALVLVQRWTEPREGTGG